jgi:diacylglycerol kinase (ATP)
VRVRLIVNPRSRRGRGAEEGVRAQLARDGVECVAAGAPARVDAIVVAGGDGTFVHYIARALELNVPLGLIPLGTFNDLARTLAIPLDIAGACEVIASRKTRRIDVARVNGVYYVNEASIGLSSRIARVQKPADKQRFGVLAIAGSVLQAFRFVRPFHAEIAFDRKREGFRAIQLTVANSQHFGGFINVDDAAIDDGRLALYAVEDSGFWPLIRAAAAVLERHAHSGAGLRVYHSTAFSVSTRRPRRISADGEPAGTTPARFEVLPAALSVFAPTGKKFEQSP